MSGKHNLRGALFGLASMGVYATHDVVVKHLGATYLPMQIMFFAALLSFPIVAIILLTNGREESLSPRHPWWIIARSVAALVTGVSAFYAFSVLPLAQTYAILFATPLVITVLSIPMLGEKVGIRRWIAVLVGLGGVMVVLRPGHEALSLGHAAALIAAFSSAFVSVVVRKIGKDERSEVLLLFPMLANVLALGVALPFVYVPMPVGDLGFMGVIAVLGLTGSYLMILAYRAGEAVVVAPMQYSQILWATLYGFLLFDESLDTATLVGAGIVIASGVYIVLREGQPQASANRPVLETRGRPEIVTTPRSSVLQRVLRRGSEENAQP